MSETTRIPVVAESPYDVIVGSGVLRELEQILPTDARQVAVVHSVRQRERAEAIAESLADQLEPIRVAVPDGEAAKTPEVATDCWRQLAQRNFTRSDALVGVGGGATTDLAGFVAATYLRGIALVQVPTTLLGMVDAAVGGKTGVNLPEGKNLVGAFHEPSAVLCDVSTLTTLPAAEMASGLAEVVKCGFIADPLILELIEADPVAAAEAQSAVLLELIERAIRVKASVVSQDLREAAERGGDVGREALNYGHTLGHAVERLERFTLRHGAAVAIGMVYVAELAALAGRLDAATVRRHRQILASVGLPTAYSAADWAAVRDAMRSDKKARGDRLRFVILESVGKPAILEVPDEGTLAAAYHRIAEDPPI